MQEDFPVIAGFVFLRVPQDLEIFRLNAAPPEKLRQDTELRIVMHITTAYQPRQAITVVIAVNG